MRLVSWRAPARRRSHRVLTFGTAQDADARLISARDEDGGQAVQAEILGRPLTLRIGAPGAHIAANAVGALLAVAEAEGDVLNAAAALARFRGAQGARRAFGVALAGGTIEVIDESYNANPASMAAALALLGSAPARAARIAVLGDMLEMGPDGRGPSCRAGRGYRTERRSIWFSRMAR